MNEKIEVFYTGGGITLAEARINTHHYAVVSSEAPEFFTVYAYSDKEETYLPEDMIFSSHKEEITPEFQPLYVKMLEKLKTA